MGTFTTAEILWMIKELQCPLDLEAIGAFTRNDVTKVLRTFIMTECNNNIVAALPLEWRPLATRHVPKIKASGPPASAAASSDPATPAEPEPTVDEIVQEMVATGSGGNGAGSGDKDGDKDDKKDEEKEADPDYEPSSDEDEEKVKIVFIHKAPPNPPRKVPVMLPATDTIKEVRSFAAGLFRMKRKDVRMLLKAPEWGEMEMDDDGKTIYDYTVALFTNGCEVEVRFSGVGGMPPRVKKEDKLKEKNAAKLLRPDRLKQIEGNLKMIGDKFKEATKLHKSLAELQTKMETVRQLALTKRDPMRVSIDMLPALEVACLKDKVTSTNTVSTRYNLLLQVLLGKELVNYDNYVKYLQELQGSLVELLHFVLEHESKFMKNYEGIMSWASVTDYLTVIINTAIPEPQGEQVPDP